MKRQYGAVLALLALSVGGYAAAATFTIMNNDGAGEGFNDPAPVTPVAGNGATTLGQARLNVLQEATRIWGHQINSSVPIVIDAEFNSLACTASSGTLGSTGPGTYFANTSGAGPLPLSNVLYPAALARAITGQAMSSTHDIRAQFNSNIDGTSPNCLGRRSFYLGLDHVPGTNNSGQPNIDLLNVMLHEIAHGLGFVSLVDQTGGNSGDSRDRLSPFDQFIYSETQRDFWPKLTDAQRAASATSNGNLTWNSPSINARSTKMTPGSSSGGHLRLYAPSTYSDGSSVSHWDTVATPDLLMEPFIRSNPNGLTDLTTCVLRDMGWPGAHCADTKVAVAQTVSAIEDTPVQFTLQGTDFFANSLLTYAVIIPPVSGSLSTPATLTSSTGVTFTYTPVANANGQDSLTFQVSDGTDTSFPATVLINVAAVNDAPVANAQSLSATAGVATAITLAATDVDSPTLTYTVLSNPSNGTLGGAPPALTYTPSAGFSGTDSFTFRANDGSLDSNTATVTISVTGPVAANSSAGSTSSAASGSGSSSGGGGSFSWLALASLLMLLLRQARRCEIT